MMRYDTMKSLCITIMRNSLYIFILLMNWYNYEELYRVVLYDPVRIWGVVELVYWSLGLMFWYFDEKKWSATERFKITNEELYRVGRGVGMREGDVVYLFPVVIRNHIVLGLWHVFYGVWCGGRGLGSEGVAVGGLSLVEFVGYFAVYLAMYDVVFYCGHYLMHLPRFYKNVHKMHHSTFGDVAISGYYMTVVDLVGEFILPMYLPMYILNANVNIAFTVAVIGQINGLVSHSGYDFPVLPYSADHLTHHLVQRKNYGVFFMDRLCGTEGG